jgi:hypothetical protein
VGRALLFAANRYRVPRVSVCNSRRLGFVHPITLCPTRFCCEGPIPLGRLRAGPERRGGSQHLDQLRRQRRQLGPVPAGASVLGRVQRRRRNRAGATAFDETPGLGRDRSDVSRFLRGRLRHGPRMLVGGAARAGRVEMGCAQGAGRDVPLPLRLLGCDVGDAGAVALFCDGVGAVRLFLEAVRIRRDRAEPHLAHGAAGCSVPLRVAGALRRRLPILRLPATGGDVEPVEHAAAAGADRSGCRKSARVGWKE